MGICNAAFQRIKRAQAKGWKVWIGDHCAILSLSLPWHSKPVQDVFVDYTNGDVWTTASIRKKHWSKGKPFSFPHSSN